MLGLLEVLEAQHSVLWGGVVGSAEQAAWVQHSGLVDSAVPVVAQQELFHCALVWMGASRG